MKSITKIFSSFVFAFASMSLMAQTHPHTHNSSTVVSYPDIPGYTTLSADLHMHTVFSDGAVWPTIRVMEALREHIDVISITDHLEYQPHRKDIPHEDRNRSYEIALEKAKGEELLIIRGSEITRSTPVGHNNAIFLEDSNPILDAKDPETGFKEAKKQGAFVFWNHPHWDRQSAKGVPIVSDFQKEKFKKGLISGVEVINEFDYSEEALQVALDYNLTIMSNSDVHGLVEWDYIEKGYHRPVTLVFAKEKSIPSIKEALFQGRTVAVYRDLWVGKPEFIVPLLHESIQVEDVRHYGYEDAMVMVTLKNVSSTNLIFENVMPYTFYGTPSVFTIPAKDSITVKIKTLGKVDRVELKLKALKAFTAPKVQAQVSWDLSISASKEE